MDKSLVNYMIEMGVVNFRLKKYDDSIRIWNECEKLLKKIPNDEEIK